MTFVCLAADNFFLGTSSDDTITIPISLSYQSARPHLNIDAGNNNDTIIENGDLRMGPSEERLAWKISNFIEKTGAAGED